MPLLTALSMLIRSIRISLKCLVVQSSFQQLVDYSSSLCRFFLVLNIGDDLTGEAVCSDVGLQPATIG